jgi:hypothetical protein
MGDAAQDGANDSASLSVKFGAVGIQPTVEHCWRVLSGATVPQCHKSTLIRRRNRMHGHGLPQHRPMPTLTVSADAHSDWLQRFLPVCKSRRPLQNAVATPLPVRVVRELTSAVHAVTHLNSRRWNGSLSPQQISSYHLDPSACAA